MAVTITSGDTINVTVTQSASSSVTITSKGPKGDTGETGATGATGAAGPAGADGKTYTISCVDGDNSDEEKIRLTDSDGTTDDVVLEAGTGMSIARSGDKITLTNTVTDTNTQLTTEQVQDIVGAMLTGNTETRISVTYDDTDGTIDFAVDDMTANDNTTFSVSCVDGDNSDEEKIRLTGSDGSTDDVVLEAGTGLSISRSSDKITFTNTVSDTNTQLSTEEVQDIVGGMFTGNTETGISATYEDSDGTIDLVVSGADKWRVYGSSNVGHTGAARFIGLRGNYVDTSSLQIYGQAMMPENCELISLTCQIGASTSVTFTVSKNGSTSVYSTGSHSFSANTPQTFTPTGTSISQGDLINISVTSASVVPGDVHLVMTFQAT
jgi:hypothetical protein